MLSLFGWAALAASPISLAVPGFQLVDLDEKHAAFLVESFAQQLSRQGFTITTQAQLGTLLGLEREKALLGCGSDGSCMLELANALGVDGLVVGTLAKIDGRYQMTVRIISASNAHLLAQWSDAFPTEDALLDAFTSIAPKLARDVERATHRGSGVRRTWALLPGAVALGLGVGAGITLGAAEGRVAMLKSGEPIPGDAKVFAQETKPLQAVGAGLCIAAGATLGVAAALLLFGADSPATPTAFIVPGGGGLALSGVFP